MGWRVIHTRKNKKRKKHCLLQPFQKLKTSLIYRKELCKFQGLYIHGSFPLLTQEGKEARRCVRKIYTQPILIKKYMCPGWCGSLGSTSACEPEAQQCDSWSPHMPGLRAMSPVGGVQEATGDQCFFPSLSLSLPLSLNKQTNHQTNKKHIHTQKWKQNNFKAQQTKQNSGK